MTDLFIFVLCKCLEYLTCFLTARVTGVSREISAAFSFALSLLSWFCRGEFTVGGRREGGNTWIFSRGWVGICSPPQGCCWDGPRLYSEAAPPCFPLELGDASAVISDTDKCFGCSEIYKARGTPPVR